MSQLVITNNSASNPQTLDLTGYMMVNDGDGLDVANPDFTQKIWSHSLLKPGATLSLEQFVEKELVFPLLIGPIGGLAGAPTTISGTLQVIQAINSIVTTPGATATWQPLGASQATTFDLLSGQADVDYSYRKEGQNWTQVTLRLFTAPLGRLPAPRPYAAASAVGPLLMISPYASGGANILTASATGYGASPQKGPLGASSGISYWGSPSLAGDAPALLQISIAGASEGFGAGYPVPTNWTAVSLLPDPSYAPLIPMLYVTSIAPAGPSVYHSANAVGSTYWSYYTNNASALAGEIKAPVVASSRPVAWSGAHRLFAIARASSVTASGTATIATLADGTLIGASTVANIPYNIGWAPCDMGTFRLAASQTPPQQGILWGVTTASNTAVDITAFLAVPDNSTWFMAGQQAPFYQSIDWAQYNCILLDDVTGDQFAYSGANQAYAPSPVNFMNFGSIRMTQFSRGLVPTPDPKNGLPCIAIMSISGQNASPNAFINTINQQISAQMFVQERFRYVSG